MFSEYLNFTLLHNSNHLLNWPANEPNMPTTRPLSSSPLIHNFLVIGERFRNHVDLDHVVQHVSDSHKKHRALLLKRPTTELSGLYTCKVSTFVSEDVRRKKMTVYCKYFFQVSCSSDQRTNFETTNSNFHNTLKSLVVVFLSDWF